MKLSVALLVAPAVHAWQADCRFPKVDWFMLDEGAGISATQKVAGMGTDTYTGGYTSGNLTLTSMTSSGIVQPTVEIMNDGSTMNMFVAQTDSTGATNKIWHMMGSTSMSGPNAGSLTDLQPFRDGTHMGVALYFRGNLSIPSNEILINNLPADQLAVAIKLDTTANPSADTSVDSTAAGVAWNRIFYSDRGSSLSGVDGDADGNMYASVTTMTCCSTAPEIDGYGRSTGRFASNYNRSLVKLASATGLTEWEVAFPAEVDSVGSVRVTSGSSPSIYLSGSFTGSDVDFGNGVTASSGSSGTVRSTYVMRVTAAGVVEWAKAYGSGFFSSPPDDLDLSKDNSVLIVAGSNSAPVTVGAASLPSGNFVMSINPATGAGVWADSIPSNTRGIEITNDNAFVVVYGQVTSAGAPITLTDANGVATTLRTRGSYDLFVAKMSATDGTGVWAIDGGGTGMEYFWGMGMDTDDNILISGYSRSAQLMFGELSRANPNTDGVNHVYTIRLSGTDTTMPACLSSCAGSTPVVSTGCYIDNHCIADGEASSYAGQSCHVCSTASSTTAWTDPGSHCYISGTCYDDGADRPPPPPPSRYGRRLAADGDEDDEMELEMARRRELQYGRGPSAPPPPVCFHCALSESASSWTMITGVDYVQGSASTPEGGTCNGPIDAYNIGANPAAEVTTAMSAATSVAAVENGLAAGMVNGVMEAAKTAYGAAPARRRELQAAEGSLQKLAQESHPDCARWVQFDTYYAGGLYSNFLDGFITAALDGTGDFANLPDGISAGRVEAVKKGVQDQLLVKEIICAISGAAGLVPANWDIAYGYFMGSNSAKTPYGRGNKRCRNYNTCRADGTTATTNMHILSGLAAGKAAASSNPVNNASIASAFTQVENQLLIIYYQAALRYSYLLDQDLANGVAVRGNDHQGEGWAFWRVIEPIIAAKSPLHNQEAQKVTSFYTTSNDILGLGAGGSTYYCTLKWLIENSLPEGTTMADLGSLSAASGVSCSYSPSLALQQTEDDGLSGGGIAAIVVGSIVIAVLLVVAAVLASKNVGPTRPGGGGGGSDGGVYMEKNVGNVA